MSACAAYDSAISSVRRFSQYTTVRCGDMHGRKRGWEAAAVDLRVGGREGLATATLDLGSGNRERRMGVDGSPLGFYTRGRQAAKNEGTWREFKGMRWEAVAGAGHTTYTTNGWAVRVFWFLRAWYC